jgi:hypothetical protein
MDLPIKSKFLSNDYCGYQVPSSVETIGWLRHILISPNRNLSATNMFLSLNMFSGRISMFFDSIATQSQMGSDQTLITA